MRFINSVSRCFPTSLPLLLIGLLVGMTVVGCTPPTDPMLEMLDADLKKTKVNDLNRTVDFIFSEVRFQQKEFEENLSSGLNRWVGYSKEQLADVDWKADPKTESLAEEFSSLQLLERNDELSYLNTDAFYLQQAVWIQQIANRAKENKNVNKYELYRLAAGNYKADDDVEDPVVEVIAKLHPELDGADAGKLASAMKLFDWVMRNVQLVTDTTIDDPEEFRLNDLTEGDAAAGIPGLGYKRYPYQCLLLGRGDYVEKAKLFMLGLRILDIDSVMLQPTGDDAKPWAVGVAVGDDYYLFDTKMALPVPGEKIGSIATLKSVRENPELLDDLDLTTEESLEDETDYWVKGDDVKKLDALVFISPESISKRMSVLERSLAGESRMKLTFGLSETAERLPKAKNVDVKAWDIAYKTHLYRQAVREALEQTSSNRLRDKLMWYYANEYYVDAFVIYRTARARFFKGKFSADPAARSRNAIESCTRILYTDAEIRDLNSNVVTQKLLGLRKDEVPDSQAFQAQIASVQNQMKLIRRDAGIHLVQCLFDAGSINAAGNWLENLKLEEDVQRWSEQITFLLGRSYESRKEYDRAIKELSDTKRDQAHGNIIRARMLKKLIDSYYSDAATETESSESD